MGKEILRCVIPRYVFKLYGEVNTHTHTHTHANASKRTNTHNFSNLVAMIADKDLNLHAGTPKCIKNKLSLKGKILKFGIEM